jgi:hypothetical protein
MVEAHPSDDLKQPVDKQAAAKFNQLIATLAERLANTHQPPGWKQDSFFRTFVQIEGGDRETNSCRPRWPRRVVEGAEGASRAFKSRASRTLRRQLRAFQTSSTSTEMNVASS